jgi:GH35 family endo-1,4-beta-xylanase
MALTQIDFDENEEVKINNYSKEWKTNKPKTVKKIVREFKEDQNVISG